jgi:hypothetical protein
MDAVTKTVDQLPNGVEVCTELRNALLQRDSASPTRWWSLFWKIPTLSTLVEFFLALLTRHGVFFDVTNASAFL